MALLQSILKPLIIKNIPTIRPDEDSEDQFLGRTAHGGPPVVSAATGRITYTYPRPTPSGPSKQRNSFSHCCRSRRAYVDGGSRPGTAATVTLAFRRRMPAGSRGTVVSACCLPVCTQRNCAGRRVPGAQLLVSLAGHLVLLSDRHQGVVRRVRSGGG